MNSDKITLYPSNWLYNAGVVGLLKVLDELNGKYRCEEFIEVDVQQNFDSNIVFDKWDEITKKKLKISYKGKFAGTQKYYYSNQTEKSIKNKIELLFKNTIHKKTKRSFYLSCFFCGDFHYTSKKEITNLNQTFGKILLGSEKSFPNTYWNFKSREYICPKCQFIVMCHHIPFISIRQNKGEKTEIFISSPLIRLTKDINIFAERLLLESKEYETRKFIGSSLLEWAIKRRTLLGAWTMMNIEVIVKKRIKTAVNKWEDIIDYFDLPYHITRILLDYEIANLIKRINEEKIFDLIVSGKFSEIEKANYFVMRGLLKLKNNENISENDPLTKYVSNYKDEHLKNICKLLPELYAKIIKILKTEVKHE